MDSQGRLGLLLLLMPLIIMIKSWNVKLGFTPAYSLCPLLKRVQKKQEQPWLGLAFLHVCMLSRFSRVQLSVTLWIVVRQTPLSMGLCQQKLLEWAAMTSSRGSSRPRDRTWVSCFLHWQTGSLSLAPPGKSSIPDIGFIYKDHGHTAAPPPTTKYISVWKWMSKDC